MSERNEVRISLLLVNELLVAATESCVDSFLDIVGSSEGTRDRLEEEEDKQQNDDERNEEAGKR